MTVRSVIDIDLRTASWDTFYREFRKYEKAVNAMPAAWQAQHQRAEGTKRSFQDLVKLRRVEAHQARMNEIATARAMRSSIGVAGIWKQISQNSLQFATNVRAGAAAITRIAGVSTVVGSLLGASGLWGLTALAGNVGGTRRASTGLNLGYGELKSFGVNLSRLVDAGSFLSNINQVLGSADKTALFGAGLHPNQMRGTTDQVAAALIPKLKEIADHTDPAYLMDYMRARGLDKLVSFEDMVRLRNTSRGEVNEVIGRYGSDVGSLSLSRQNQKLWQDFSVQIGRVTEQLENTLAKTLVGLAPGLTKLSGSFESVIRTFAESSTIKDWIDKAGGGLEKLASYIGTPEFKANVETFASGLGKIATAIGEFVKWFGVGRTGNPEFSTWNDMRGGAQKMREDRASGKSTGLSQLGDVFNKKLSMDDLVGIVRKLEASGDAAVSPAGAIGRFQVMPSTARLYGGDVSKLTDPAYNERIARMVLADLVKTYGGDLERVLVGYNASSLTRKRFAESGNPAVLPDETRRYRERGLSLAGGLTRVEITNATGGNVNVSTTQIAQ